MPTRDTESEISDLLAEWITRARLPLDIYLPTSDTIRLGSTFVRSPDIVVINKETGKTLGIEIKSGRKELAIGLYPSFQEMQDQFRETDNDFIVLSTVPPSGVLHSIATEAGIPVFEIHKPSEAIDVLKPRLEALVAKKIGAH